MLRSRGVAERLRTAIVSAHSHGDRSFLDDRELALLSGDLRARRADHAWIVAVCEQPDALPPGVLEALRGVDVVLFERLWDPALLLPVRGAMPDAVFVHLEGEHVLEDPPAEYVCGGQPRRTVPALLRHLEGDAPLPTGVRKKVAEGWRPGLGALPAAPAGSDDGTAFAPDLHPRVIPEGALPADRSFSLLGNPGCPYQADARDNPAYAGVELPEGLGRGCAFCVTGNHYEPTPHAETAARLLAQIRYVREHDPGRRRLVLKDQNPFAYLPRVLRGVRDEGLGGFSLLLETRADWFLAAGARLEEALRIAAEADVRVAPFLVGIENFAPAELERMNKGSDPATLERFLRDIERWERDFEAFDLSEASFGFVLFTPWTTLADLRTNLDAVERTGLHRWRGHFLLSRVRLYPDTAMHYLAKRDGLLVDPEDEDAGAWDDSSARYGYYAAPPWRFQDPDVARYAALAAEALRRLGGRDELALWRALQEAFEAGRTPTVEALVEAVAQRPDGGRRAGTGGGRVMQAGLGGACALRCAPCDCRRIRPTAPDALQGKAERLVLRGGARSLEELRPLVERARELGVPTVVLRTHGLHARSAAAATQLARWVDVLLVPVFSERAAVHDAVTGVRGAFEGTREAMRAARAAGLALELEVPLLSPALQSLASIVELAAEHGAKVVRFVVPRHEVPAKLAPPPWSQVAGPLADALRKAAALGIETPLDPPAAVPLCALREHPDVGVAHQVSPPRKGGVRADGAALVGACEGCGLRDRCPGVARSYRDAHGERDLQALDALPLELESEWTEDRREAARTTRMLVVRPTVHCNQDCVFCSANETSKNVLEDGGEMMRAIARAADRGLERVSFSGGEPTLHRDLPSFVQVARDCGVSKIELVTNGVLLAKRAKVQRLVDAGLTHAFVSLHAHDEALSRAQTLKAGDFERTLRAVEHLLNAGVVTVLNHVLNARNHRYVREFVRMVRARFEGRVLISIAFVTPQYKALEHPELVPSITDVWPTLRSALHEAVALQQPVVIGSRQGIPPCLLGEFEAWSDLVHVSAEGRAEDTPQKVRAAACEGCRYARLCTGLWRPYVERFGTDELRAVGTEPWTQEHVARVRAHPRPAPHGVYLRFEDLPPELRHPELEAEGRARAEEPAPAPRRLPVVSALRSRGLRVAVAGTGMRARQLIARIDEVPDLMVCAVASPHAPEASLEDLRGAPRFRDVGEMLEETRPDALVIACATEAHAEVAAAAFAEGIPVLIEKPLTPDAESARALVADAEAAGVPLFVAHNLAHHPGLDVVLAARGAVRIVRQVGKGQPDAPIRWSRDAMRESLLHLVSVALRAAGAPLQLVRAHAQGDGRPLRIDARFEGDAVGVDVRWSADEPADRFEVSRGDLTMVREGREAVLRHGSGEPARLPGSDTGAMLAALRDRLLHDEADGPWLAPTWHGPAAIELTDAWLDALDVPWSRATEPRRARTRAKPKRETPKHAGVALRELGGGGNADPVDLLKRPSSATPSWEERAFAAGLKPVLYLVVSPEDADATLEGLRSRLGEVAVRRFDFREEVAAGDVRRRGAGLARVALMVSREAAKAERAAALQQDDPSRHAAELGALMGYPACCVQAFLRQDARNDNAANRHLAARRTSAARWPWELNDFVDKPFPFHPCRYDCDAALGFARAVYATLDEDARATLARRLARPLLYLTHGQSLHFDGVAQGTRIEDVRGVHAVGDVARRIGGSLRPRPGGAIELREGRLWVDGEPRFEITDEARVTLAPFGAG